LGCLRFGVVGVRLHAFMLSGGLFGVSRRCRLLVDALGCCGTYLCVGVELLPGLPGRCLLTLSLLDLLALGLLCGTHLARPPRRLTLGIGTSLGTFVARLSQVLGGLVGLRVGERLRTVRLLAVLRLPLLQLHPARPAAGCAHPATAGPPSSPVAAPRRRGY